MAETSREQGLCRMRGREELAHHLEGSGTTDSHVCFEKMECRENLGRGQSCCKKIEAVAVRQVVAVP